DEVSALGEARKAGERAAVADEAVLVSGKLLGEELVTEVARPVAVQDDSPRLRVALRVSQRGERDAHLERPAFRRDAGRGIPEEVGRGILVARRVVGHR